MKISQEKMFKPVTITLESQLEVDALYVIIGKVAESESGFPALDLYLKLKSFSSEPEELLVKAGPLEASGIGFRLEKGAQ